MTFGAGEESRRGGKPVSLYYFRYGMAEASYYAFTDAEHNVLGPGSFESEPVNYDPEAIERSPLTSSGTLDKVAITITVPRDNPLADLFRVYPPSQVVTVIIRQWHVGASTSPVAWAGRAVGMKFEGSAAELTCEPVATSMRRNGLRRHYQYGCPHALYGADCRADKEAATGTFAVDGVGTTTIALVSGWDATTPPAAKFHGGLVEWTTPEGNVEIRTILSVAGDTLILNGIVRGLQVSDLVSISLGCNRQQDDCRDLHNNIHNYGGQDWIPTINPIGARNQFY